MTLRRFACRLLVLGLLLPAGAGRGLRAQPAAFPALDTLIQAEVDQGRIAGAVIQVARDGRVLHRRAYGYAQRYAYGREPLRPPDAMTDGLLFDLASLTKVFATTFGVMRLVGQGRVALDEPVRTYLPDFTGGGKERITVRHLLTHTAGLAEWEPVYYHADTKAGAYRHIRALPLAYDVGAGRHYSDLGFMLLGLLVERVTGQALDAYLADTLYGPLNLRHTLFRPLDHGVAPEAIAATSHGNPFERRMVYDDTFGYVCDEDPTSWDGWRTYTLRGEVNDGNAYYAFAGVAGHAGLFSTVDDLQRLVDLLLHEGIDQGTEVLDPAVVRTFLTKDAYGNGLGWAMDPSVIHAPGAPEGTFGHTGFTGTSVVVVPAYGLSILLLTNRQNVGVDASGAYANLNPLRRRVFSLVLDAVRGMDDGR